VTVTDECGGTVTGLVALRSDTPPAIQLPPIMAQGCAPLQVQFPTLNLGNVVYTWDLGNGSTTMVPAPQLTYGSGTYTASLTVTTALGCTSSSNGGGQIIAYASPTADFDASPWTTNIEAATVDFTDLSQGSITSYDWVFGDGGTSTAMSPSYQFNDIGTFDVELYIMDVNGCTANVSHPVTIDPVYDVVIPTAFTPNPNGGGGNNGSGSGSNWATGDLSNDVFYPFVKYVKDFRMRVFNRWGELIFESNDLAIGWDGYYRGELSPQDVYVVQTWYRFVDGKQIEKLSDLTLFR
jgi:gliding motility-associated-like protein